MPASTNQLVTTARKIALPAGIAAATAVLASAFAIHANNVHASAVSAAPLDDQSVEVLMSDARYDYLAPVPVTDDVLYAMLGSEWPSSQPRP